MLRELLPLSCLELLDQEVRPRPSELVLRLHVGTIAGAGIHPKAVSERLGHSSVAFTMDTYAAVIPSLGRAAADAADTLFGEEGGR